MRVVPQRFLPTSRAALCGALAMTVAIAISSCTSESSGPSEDTGGRAGSSSDGGRGGGRGGSGGAGRNGGAGGSLDVRVDASTTTGDAGSPADAAPRTDSAVPEPIESPCPVDGSPCRVMPLGDSITQGVGSTIGGYRVPLWKRLVVEDGRAMTFVGEERANSPMTVDGRAFPVNHEGHPGYSIDKVPGQMAFGGAGITPLVAEVITKHKPHVVLLMIGTNDINNRVNPPGAPARLAALVDKILALDPKLLLLLAKIVPSKDDALNGLIRAYNDAMPALVNERIAAGKRMGIVDMYGAFVANPSYKTALMDDGLHPNDAGYVVMAEVWSKALKPLLK